MQNESTVSYQPYCAPPSSFQIQTYGSNHPSTYPEQPGAQRLSGDTCASVPPTTEKYKCEAATCEKSFKRPVDLKRHADIHKPQSHRQLYPCDYRVCQWDDKSFRKDHLRDHLRDFHHEDLLKPRSKRKESDEWWAESKMEPDWWRCSRCLQRSRTIETWNCEHCEWSCEPDRIAHRSRRSSKVLLKTTSNDIVGDTSNPGCVLCDKGWVWISTEGKWKRYWGCMPLTEASTSQNVGSALPDLQYSDATIPTSRSTDPAPVSTSQELSSKQQRSACSAFCSNGYVLTAGIWQVCPQCLGASYVEPPTVDNAAPVPAKAEAATETAAQANSPINQRAT